MSKDSVLIVGWNRVIPGRENDALELFTQSINYYQAQQKAGHITAFEPIFLRPHGGDLNGFFLLRGERAKLDAMKESDEFLNISTRGIVLLEGFGVIDAYAGEGVQKLMGFWTKAIAKN